MIEDKAKQKWCPFASSRAVESHSEDDILSYGAMKNKSGEGINLLCIASECMAWRWDKGSTEGRERGGFCGLAGKP